MTCPRCGAEVVETRDSNGLPATIIADGFGFGIDALVMGRSNVVYCVPREMVGEGETVYAWHDVSFTMLDGDLRPRVIPNIRCGEFIRPDEFHVTDYPLRFP